ncbi:MAG TPA: hypothetical protein VHV76_03720 [Mycobacteriales bacterium]|jgi:hypothetical protein|nr:hypothetical protein [Mycobacteriales bacterium]
MADASPRRYRALILCPMRRCQRCEDVVPVREDKCTECGTHIPKPPPRIPRPRQELRAIPATCWGLEHAAKTNGSLDVAAMPGIN